MTSQLNVDTIVDKAGSGGTNVKIANTSVTVGTGGSGTLNTSKGLIKVRHDASADGATLNDSLNVSSLTDDSTGRQTINIASAMTNGNYSVTQGLLNNLAEPFVSNDRTTTAYQSNMYDGSYIDSAQNTMASGDLA